MSNNVYLYILIIYNIAFKDMDSGNIQLNSGFVTYIALKKLKFLCVLYH